jgi:hypothetical protein
MENQAQKATLSEIIYVLNDRFRKLTEADRLFFEGVGRGQGRQ